MKCAEVRKLLPARFLGDLDVEAAYRLEDHLKGCAECRLEAEAVERALGMARSVLEVPPSAERRSTAVVAMARARAGEAGRAISASRSRWLRGAAAAILVAVAGGIAALLVGGGEDLEYEAAEVRGRARLLDPSGRAFPLASGMRVRGGHRVLTEPGTVVRLDAGIGDVYLDQNTSVAFVTGRRLLLDRGRVCLELPGAYRPGLEIADPAGNVVGVRQGRMEAGIRDVYALVAAATTFLPAPDPGASVRLVDVPFVEAAGEISRRTGRPLEAATPETAARKVTFYGRMEGGVGLFEEFSRAMERQNITIREGRASYAAPVVRKDVSPRLFARVASGEAVFTGARDQRLIAGAGQAGHFDLGGRPLTRGMEPGEVAPWRRGEAAGLARLAIGVPMSFHGVGRDEGGRLVLECRIEGSEVQASFEGFEGTLRIPGGETGRVGPEGGEIAIPLLLKLEPKR